LRIAFDHLGLKKPYEQSIRWAHEYGLNELSNYMLYNFHDSPADLFERMRLNVRLNEELGTRIWSFPMRYQPTDLPDRSFVGGKWTRFQLRSMQIILQATHGVVSGAPKFFKRAFGNTVGEFEGILLRPHQFTFNREWYETKGGKAELEEYRAELSKLSISERAELLFLLSSTSPRGFVRLPLQTQSQRIKRVLRFYVPLSEAEERRIWARQRANSPSMDSLLPEDERVEDAGLSDDTEETPSIPALPFARNDTRQVSL
jgi:hypothetical protein